MTDHTPDQPKRPWWRRWWGITGIGLVLLVAIAGFAGGGDEAPDASEAATEASSPTEAEPSPDPTYPEFEDVDPHTSQFFIALEDTDLVDTYGERQLYNHGVNACRALDRGDSVEQELTAMAEEGGYGDAAGDILGAALNDMCPQHRQAAQDYLDNR